ncbi:AraC family transcriptional regulator [Pedobacter cryoconitis]|uniref:AraC-like DNA-binding protein n=1 Tax=Pedobacter cryoconitis TaxID=188932 RepID=A0A7X0MHD6_9SPHI|nr:helix-turn-helix domain-containing protein [Pedobacter cryoconitis]MBB6498736.1 AraC-like DNA-binding protein [Pedobacter cryoconitis]
METSDQNGRLHLPDPSLREIISHFYHIYNTADTIPVLKHLSPNLEMLLAFNFGSPISISFNHEQPGNFIVNRVVIIGPLRKMLNYELHAGADAIIVNFKLDGFYRLFHQSLDELTGDGILDPVILTNNNYLNELWEELATLPDLKERLQMLNNYISSLIHTPEEAAKPLLAAEPYFHNPRLQPVKAIAADTNLTERSIQLRFKKYTGYSPKELLRFLRFKAVIHEMLKQPAQHLTVFDLINKYNYHDQSHLIKDFKTFLGTTPLKFIKSLKNNQFCVSGQAEP